MLFSHTTVDHSVPFLTEESHTLRAHSSVTYRNVRTAQIKKGKSFQEVQRKQCLEYNVT